MPLTPYCYVAPPPFQTPTDNHYFIVYEFVSALLYSLVNFLIIIILNFYLFKSKFYLKFCLFLAVLGVCRCMHAL